MKLQESPPASSLSLAGCRETTGTVKYNAASTATKIRRNVGPGLQLAEKRARMIKLSVIWLQVPRHVFSCVANHFQLCIKIHVLCPSAEWLHVATVTYAVTASYIRKTQKLSWFMKLALFSY